MSDPVQTVEKMKQACCEATGVRDSKISDRSALSNGRQASNDRWMTPLLGWVKINCDAAWKEPQNYLKTFAQLLY